MIGIHLAPPANSADVSRPLCQLDAQDAGNLDGVQLSYLHRVVGKWAGMVAHWPKQRGNTECVILPGYGAKTQRLVKEYVK